MGGGLGAGGLRATMRKGDAGIVSKLEGETRPPPPPRRSPSAAQVIGSESPSRRDYVSPPPPVRWNQDVGTAQWVKRAKGRPPPRPPPPPTTHPPRPQQLAATLRPRGAQDPPTPPQAKGIETPPGDHRPGPKPV